MERQTKFPNPTEIKQIDEPSIAATGITSEEYVGAILKLLEEKRGKQKKFEHIGTGRVMPRAMRRWIIDFLDIELRRW